MGKGQVKLMDKGTVDKDNRGEDLVWKVGDGKAGESTGDKQGQLTEQQ